MLPLDFTEDDVYGTAGVLGAESIELRNWLVFLGYTSEDLRVVVTILDEWMSNSSPLMGRLSRTNGFSAGITG